MDAYTKSSDITVDGLSTDSGFLVFLGPPDQPNTWQSGNVIQKSQPMVNSLSGFRNPAWKAQVRSGQDATTPCSGISWRSSLGWHAFGFEDYCMNTQTGQVAHIKSDSGIRFPNPLNSINSPSADDIARVRNQVIQRFLTQAKSVQSSFESGQDLGEYRETVESIHRPLSSLHSKLLSYFSSLEKVKKRYKRVPSLKKALADTYLEFRFGWLPLVDDVASAITSCGQFRFPVQRISASKTLRFSADSSIGELGGFFPGHSDDPRPYVSILDHSEYILRYRGGIRTGADPSGRSSSVRELQLLPRDWLPTAWDLLPYSWIADYFTNIGEMIQSLCFCASDLAWGSVSEIITRTYEYHDISWHVPMPYFGPQTFPWVRLNANNYSIPDTTTFQLRQWVRQPMNISDLFASFEFRIPTSKYPYYNLAALLISRAAKLVPFF